MLHKSSTAFKRKDFHQVGNENYMIDKNFTNRIELITRASIILIVNWAATLAFFYISVYESADAQQQTSEFSNYPPSFFPNNRLSQQQTYPKNFPQANQPFQSQLMSGMSSPTFGQNLFNPSNAQILEQNSMNQQNMNSFDFDYSKVDRRQEEGWYHLYGFGEVYDDVELGDRQEKEVQIDLDFFLPFYGFRFNYTFMIYKKKPTKKTVARRNTISNYIKPPYEFPAPDWPKQRDPSLIAIFLMEQDYVRVHNLRISNLWYRIITRPTDPLSLMQNRDQIQSIRSFLPSGDRNYKRIAPGRVEDPTLLDEITRDIQNSVVGARGFNTEYALIVTWERMGYGGSPRITDISRLQEAKRAQNTYQMVVATDEIRTYTIFNYAKINWTSSTQAGSISGRGGMQSAVVGFNGGNNTGWTSMPWSAEGNSYKLVQYGNTNVAGRWVARVDEQVEIGGCSNDSRGIVNVDKPLVSMLGGFTLNVTAACFRGNEVIKLQIDEITVDCSKINMVIARCVVPIGKMFKTGMVEIKLSVDGGNSYPWTNKLYILTPSLAYQDVSLVDSTWSLTDKWNNYNAENLTLKWHAANLTSDHSTKVDVILWGYWEDALEFSFEPIGFIAKSVPNKGLYTFRPKTLDRSNIYFDAWRRMSEGLIQAKVSNFRPDDMGDGVHWSKLVSFGWFFREIWQEEYGKNWAFDHCVEWYTYDGRRENFYSYLETEISCPCTLQQALIDVGRFVSMSDCDMSGNHQCYYHKGAKHCVLSTNSA